MRASKAVKFSILLFASLFILLSYRVLGTAPIYEGNWCLRWVPASSEVVLLFVFSWGFFHGERDSLFAGAWVHLWLTAISGVCEAAAPEHQRQIGLSAAGRYQDLN